MGATEFDKPLDHDLDELNSNLGSPSSASGVTGADAFTKINTLNSNIATYTKGSSAYTETITSGHTFTATKNCIFTVRFYAGFCGLVPLDSQNGVCGPQCEGWNGGIGPTNSSTVSICLKKNAQCKIWTSATIVEAIIYDI